MPKSMDDIVKQFLVSEKDMAPSAAEDFVADLRKHEDIYSEFVDFIETGHYNNGAESEGWTAEKLAEKFPHLDSYVIYELLMGLRDDTEKYRGYIKDGMLYL